MFIQYMHVYLYICIYVCVCCCCMYESHSAFIIILRWFDRCSYLCSMHSIYVVCILFFASTLIHSVLFVFSLILDIERKSKKSKVYWPQIKLHNKHSILLVYWNLLKHCLFAGASKWEMEWLYRTVDGSYYVQYVFVNRHTRIYI